MAGYYPEMGTLLDFACVCVCVCVCARAHVSLPSTSEWHTTEPDITQMTAASDWSTRNHYKKYDKTNYFRTSDMMKNETDKTY
jgi:hypothetical protein